MDAAGYHNTSIVAADGNWAIANDVLKDKELAAAMDVIGYVYSTSTMFSKFTFTFTDSGNFSLQLGFYWGSEVVVHPSFAQISGLSRPEPT